MNSNDAANLDKFIETLMECKPLRESEVKFICEKVSNLYDKGQRSVSKGK